MALYSSDYLKSKFNATAQSIDRLVLNESHKQLSSYDIFLSHSFLDKEEVGGLYLELTGRGYSVYVDWIIDPHLDRNNVTKESAELVRKRMDSSKSLLLAVSENAALSKWIPWELGYVDGHTSHKCAIVPVSKGATSSSSFKRVEYLLLYPYIKRANIDSLDGLFVVESGYSYVNFGSWTKGSSTPQAQIKNIDYL